MKAFLAHVATVFVTMFLHGVLISLRHSMFNAQYDICKAALVSDKNYQSVEQVSKCVKHSSKTLRLIATLINEDGSFLEGSD